MSARTRFLAFTVALAVVGGGCGDSPTDPSGSLNLAGSWTGTWQYVASGVTVTDDVEATITQNGSNATGTWTSASGATGSLSLTVASDLSGTITITQTPLASNACTASTSLSGSATSSTMDFTLGAITGVGLCQWAASQRFVLEK
ncbi:MAG TPA: hypothetical protein VFO19_17625 [Vicinamibacterales bacterium]|nr:hypothetical protein [Vicinamibacterales bacterium]